MKKKEELESQPEKREINYYSREEAAEKWAKFFDKLKWPYKYEPFTFNGFTPYFILNFEKGPIIVVEKRDSKKAIYSGWRGGILSVFRNGPWECTFDTDYGAYIGKFWDGKRSNKTSMFVCKTCGHYSFTNSSDGCVVSGCGERDFEIETIPSDFFVKMFKQC